MMFEKIKHSPLFRGIDESQLASLLACLTAVKRRYRKDELIFVAGEKPISCRNRTIW